MLALSSSQFDQLRHPTRYLPGSLQPISLVYNGHKVSTDAPQPRSSTVKFTAMRRTILILFTVAGLSSQETFAGDCDAHSGCRKFSIYQAAPTYGPPPFVAFGSTVGPIVGCYGFDHGPIYSPHPCNFPYPCEYYGTCKAAAKPYKGTF